MMKHLVLTMTILWVRSGPVAAEPLQIVLTNDDGFESPGIRAVFQSLKQAGHKVTLVAPAENQSGSSASISHSYGEEFQFEEKEDGVWAVEGTPGDSVIVALRHLFKDSRPDLIISGANRGQNLGAIANFSGTVGAAITATHLDVPAIAVSVGIVGSEYNATPPYKSTLAVFPDAGAFTAKLVKHLQGATPPGQRLIPRGVLLSVNYPIRSKDQIKGVAFARVANANHTSPSRSGYEVVSEGRLKKILLPREKHSVWVKGTDEYLFRGGHITLSLLRPNLGANDSQHLELFRILNAGLHAR